MPTENVRRRNIFLGLALLCLAVGIMYLLVVSQLYQHGPLVASGAFILSVIFLVLWWRTPRT